MTKMRLVIPNCHGKYTTRTTHHWVAKLTLKTTIAKLKTSWVLSSLVFHVGGRGGSGTALCFGTAWRFGSAGASPSAILGPVGLCVLFIFSILPSHLEKTSDQQAGHKVKPRFDSTRFFEPASWPIKTSKLAKEPSDLKTDQQAGQSAQHLFIHSSDCFPN